MPKDQPINILLVGGGGREHALAWKLRQSERLGALWTTHPQNPGLARLAKPCEEPYDLKQVYRLQQFCQRRQIDLVVIGPEDPLAAGLADALRTPRCAVFGPSAAAARLEADKAWAKQLMRAAAIPTAEARVFTEPEAAREYLSSREEAQVVKAAGLARGKGVVVPDSLDEALEAIERIMVRREFGDAGERVVIEERLKGPEASVLALVDGRTIYMLDPCQDHKRLLEGDAGPNTGGMGAFCPSTMLDERTLERVERDVFVPIVDILRREDIEYRGVLYAGLILTHAGPKVLEFNVRFGDPECQALLPRLRCDLVDVLHKNAVGRLHEARIEHDPRVSCCIVLASAGYPERPSPPAVIEGVEEAEAIEGVTVFHTGTATGADGRLVTAGGRVLNVVAMGDTLESARELALRACDAIRFDGKQVRRDIGAAPTVTKSAPHAPARDRTGRAHDTTA